MCARLAYRLSSVFSLAAAAAAPPHIYILFHGYIGVRARRQLFHAVELVGKLPRARLHRTAAVLLPFFLSLLCYRYRFSRAVLLDFRGYMYRRSDRVSLSGLQILNKGEVMVYMCVLR